MINATSRVNNSNVEFQVVVLAGGSGIRLYPLTENQPKALLPIDNKPLLWYQLDLLERSGFIEVIVITSEDMQTEINQFVQHDYGGKIAIDLVSVPGNLETADALRHVQDKIKTENFMVIAGDLITDVVIHNLADLHRIQDASVTMLLKEQRKYLHAEKKKSKPRRDEDMIDCIGLVEEEQRVVFLSPAVHLDDDFVVPKALLRKRNRINMRTDVIDSHFYIFNRWILTLLQEKKHIASIKADLLPHLVRRQFRGPEALPDSVRSRIGNDQALAASVSSSEQSSDELVRVCAFIMKAGIGYCERAVTTTAYEAMKREVKSKMFANTLAHHA